MPTPADTRFVVDVMCGRLARHLRMCGFDTAYALDRGVEADADISRIAAAEGRILLTRDRAFAARTPDAVCLRSRDIEGQLRELKDRGVALSLAGPSRCATCNGVLERVEPTAETPDNVPDPVKTAVWWCAECGQAFWRGSHWDDVRARLDGL